MQDLHPEREKTEVGVQNGLPRTPEMQKKTSGPDVFFRVRQVRLEPLDLLADQEVVHQESHPAERHHGDGEKNLVEGFEFVVLEDVEHTPHCGHDAEDVNNGSDHNSII